MTSAAAYTTFNMGCGFAVYCAGGAGAEVVRLAASSGLSARWRAWWNRARGESCSSRSTWCSRRTTWISRRAGGLVGPAFQSTSEWEDHPWRRPARPGPSATASGCARTGDGVSRIGGVGRLRRNRPPRRSSSAAEAVQPSRDRGVKPKSVTPAPGTQMSCAELPRGADAPAGRVHDRQTKRREHDALRPRAGAVAGTEEGRASSRGCLVVVTADADVILGAEGQGSTRRPAPRAVAGHAERCQTVALCRATLWST